MPSVRERLTTELAGRYRIERELGQGGMAVVFLAEDVKHGRRVALKVLRPELGHALGVDRFLREIRIAAGLSHPNILPLFDSGEADGLLYFVMPYVEGETLARLLARDGPMEIDRAIAVVGELADALGRAHAAGVVHRDIKPGNVLLESGRPLLADFGVARAIDAAGGDRLTRTGMAVGTPAYMSPEQVTGDAMQDARSDTYSLACVAYEMIAGRPPFVGSSAQAVAAAHLSRPAPPLGALRKEVPPTVARVVERALAKDPMDRYATAPDFAEALRAANTEAAKAAEARRRRWRAVAGAAGVVALAIGGWWGAQRLGAPAVERLAVLPATNLTGDAEQDYFVDGVHQALVTELQRAGIATIARQSVLRYRDTDKTVQEIARELSVDALIEPSVGRVGDSVTVEVALVDARTQLSLWSGRYERPVSGVLALYRELSGAIASEIGTALTEEAEVRLAERPVVDPQAYEDYLRGQYHLSRFTAADFTRARGYFESALRRDPDYADAYLGLRGVWGFQAQAGLVASTEARERQQELLARALELDPDLPEANAMFANETAWVEWDPHAAEPLFRRAIEIDPGNARLRAFHGHVLTILGRWDEADEEMRESLELDPLDSFLRGLYGTQLTMVGRVAEALVVLEEMYRNDPGVGFGDAPYRFALHEAGRHEEELRFMVDNQRSRGAPEVAAAIEEGFAEGGEEEADRRAVEALIERRGRRHVGGLAIATHLVRLGEHDRAVDWLETEVEERGRNVPYFGVLAPLWPLHDHPRFQALIRELQLAPLKPEGR